MNLIKNQIIQKFQNLKFKKTKVVKQKIHLKNHLTRKLCSMNSKCLTLDVQNSIPLQHLFKF